MVAIPIRCSAEVPNGLRCLREATKAVVWQESRLRDSKVSYLCGRHAEELQRECAPLIQSVRSL